MAALSTPTAKTTVTRLHGGFTLSARQAFISSEAAASRRFMDRFTNSDFEIGPGGVSYSREYRCGCGFRCSDAGAIFDHTCPDPDEQDDDGYREHIKDCLRFCRCCDCSDRPCAGTMAGGVCDQACRCEQSDEDEVSP